MDNKSKTKLIFSVLVLGSCWSIVYLIPFIQYVFYDPFKEMIGATNAQLGLLMSIYGFGNIYGCPLGGWIADRFNYKIVYMGSVFLNGVFGLLFVSNPTYSFAVIMWVGFAITSLVMNYPAHIKIIRNLVSDEDQGKIFGLNETSVGIGNIVFNAVMMFLFNRFLQGIAGLSAAIIGLSVLSILLTIPAFFVIESPKKSDVKKEIKEPTVKLGIKEYVEILKDPSTWLVALSIFCIYSFLVTMSYFTPYFTDVLGATVAFSGIVAIIRTYVMTLVGAPIGGYLTDKIKSASKVLIFVQVVGIISLIVMLNLSQSTPMYALIVLTLVMALAVYMGRGSYYAVISELNINKNRTASTIGIAAAVGFSPDLFQFLLFGNWLDAYGQTGYTYMFIFQIIVLTIGVGTAFAVLKLKKRNRISKNIAVETV
ncbi:MAG: MFS transporter [Sedimentibacter sp.]|uniref:MFS transporter n=1 Tax=Sedimentibacter sp. TaxID=1960295 RepID=UPI00315868C9